MIVDGRCIVFAGALHAYDLGTGESKWKWSGASAPYGSPALMTVDGVKQIVTPAMGVLAGVNAADGIDLWKVKIGSGAKFDYASNYSTPMIDGDKVYYSITGGKGGGGGTIGLKIEKDGDKFAAKELWRVKFAAAGYHAPTLRDGLIYGLSAAGRKFFCMDARNGEERWKDDTTRGACGAIVNAGSVLLALTSDKDLVVIRPGAKYEEVAKYRVSSDETWCVPIVAGNRIYVKDKGGNLTLWTIE
jgi:outer membrane protein assembly factor BamB